MRVVATYHYSPLGTGKEAVERLLNQEHGITYVHVINDLYIPFGKTQSWTGNVPQSAKHLIEVAKPVIASVVKNELVRKLALLSKNPVASGGSAPSREISEIEEKFLKTGKRSPSTIYKLTAPAPLWSVMKELGIEVYKIVCLGSTCSTGNHALEEALQKGDFAVTLAAEDTFSPSRTVGYVKVGLLVDKNKGLPLPCIFPFQQLGDNTVIGAGAAALVLAKDDLLKKAGADPERFPELKAAVTYADTYAITATDPEGKALEKTLLECVEKAGWKPEDVHVIKAHATGTMMNDVVEAKLYRKHFKNAVVTFLKQYMGHSFLACAAVENALMIDAIHHGFVPAPLIRAPLIEEAKELNIPEKPLEAREKINVLSVSCGFAGIYSVAAFSIQPRKN